MDVETLKGLIEGYEGFELHDALTFAIDNLFYATIAGKCSPDENTLYRLISIRDVFFKLAADKKSIAIND